ncbi:MAG: hypothetical protein KC910_12090 [Candidatus Eremiobacteraeota bacterium]|nr:hypothetical protein [Candidatus Eremiobacteraeota bacterium]
MSLIEVFLALTILAIAGLGLIAALTRALSVQNYSSSQTVARMLAEGLIQKAVLADPSEWDGVERTVQKRIGQQGLNVTFHYVISPGELVRGTSPPDPMGTLYQVRLRMWWSETEGQGGGPERGTKTLHVSRMVYVQE